MHIPSTPKRPVLVVSPNSPTHPDAAHKGGRTARNLRNSTECLEARTATYPRRESCSPPQLTRPQRRCHRHSHCSRGWLVLGHGPKGRSVFVVDMRVHSDPQKWFIVGHSAHQDSLHVAFSSLSLTVLSGPRLCIEHSSQTVRTPVCSPPERSETQTGREYKGVAANAEGEGTSRCQTIPGEELPALGAVDPVQSISRDRQTHRPCNQ